MPRTPRRIQIKTTNPVQRHLKPSNTNPTTYATDNLRLHKQHNSKQVIPTSNARHLPTAQIRPTHPHEHRRHQPSRRRTKRASTTSLHPHPRQLRPARTPHKQTYNHTDYPKHQRPLHPIRPKRSKYKSTSPIHPQHPRLIPTMYRPQPAYYQKPRNTDSQNKVQRTSPRHKHPN